MTKLSLSEKEWDRIKPGSVKKTGISEAIRQALKAIPGGDTDKIASYDACGGGADALDALERAIDKAQPLIDKAKDDAKGAGKTLKGWSKEIADAKDAVKDRRIALILEITAPVLAKWTGPRKDLESKVQGVIQQVREADNDMGHSEQLREECVIGMVQRAGELQEEGHIGKVPEDFLGDSDFKAAYGLWQDQIKVTVRRTKELEVAQAQRKQIQKLIVMMEQEVKAANDKVAKLAEAKSTEVKKFTDFADDVHGFYVETCTDNAKKYHVFALIPDFPPASEVEKSEQQALLKRFAKMKKVDADSYLENKLAAYGLNEKRLNKALQSVNAANKEVEGLTTALRKGGANQDREADIKTLKGLAGEIEQTNKTYIKARANQEVAQALSRPENAKYAQTVKAALAFMQTSTDKANSALKEFS